MKHHQLNKKTRIFRNSLSKQEYRELEEEADTFAAYILVPHAVLPNFGVRSKDDIAHQCKISLSAAAYRFTDYTIWIRKSKLSFDDYDRQIRHLFFSAPSNQDYIYCPICGNKTGYNGTHFCKICGNSTARLFKGEKSYMIKYSCVEVDENGKAQVCPKCQNGDVSAGGFCKICGTRLENLCQQELYDERGNYDGISPCEESIEHPLAGDARYCPYCGSETTFNKDRLLKNWQTEQADIQAEKELDGLLSQPDSKPSNYEEIPDDDTLPF